MYENSILKDIENIHTLYISGHINPDGDAIGSVFAFALAMKQLGKNPVILIEDYDKKFNVLKGKEYIYKGDYSDINPEIMFAIDCGSKDRLGKTSEVFDRAKLTYNIDHHISNSNFANKNIVNGSASSASEIVYEIISKFVDIDSDIASAIYTGILLDTGGFMHNCTSERTHQIAGRLISAGVDTPFIHSKMLKEHTISQVKVFNKALDNLCIDNGVAYTFLTAKEINDCNAVSSDLDGIVEYILNIDGVKVSMLVTQRKENFVKLSFRSKTIDVNKVASVFGGGGHTLAAGAGVSDKSIYDIIDEAAKMLKDRIADYEK